MRVLDLFSGIGGFSLGLERAGMKTVAFCEIDPFCRRVLAKHWPGVPCYEDVRTLTAERLRADGISVDLICGGFPCQDISSAGKKAGISGRKSGLWSEYARLVRELRPKFVIVENVAALAARGLERVLGDLAINRYDAEWTRISACDLGAPHGRDRQWIVAYPNDEGQSVGSGLSADGGALYTECRKPKVGLHLARARWVGKPLSWDGIWPGEDSPLGMGVDDGLSERLDRLKGLGNAAMPQIPEIIGRAIMSAAA